MIVDRCKLLVEDGLVPETVRPVSWRRFADNVFALVRTHEQNPRRIEHEVSRLLETIEADLRGATPFELPVSGSVSVRDIGGRES
jgi:hypothetical protein